MVQICLDARFVVEADDKTGIARGFAQGFDRNDSAYLGVNPAKHFAHAARAEAINNTILTDKGSYHENQNDGVTDDKCSRRPSLIFECGKPRRASTLHGLSAH